MPRHELPIWTPFPGMLVGSCEDGHVRGMGRGPDFKVFEVTEKTGAARLIDGLSVGIDVSKPA